MFLAQKIPLCSVKFVFNQEACERLITLRLLLTLNSVFKENKVRMLAHVVYLYGISRILHPATKEFCFCKKN
jgi:hypothetical protein